MAPNRAKILRSVKYSETTKVLNLQAADSHRHVVSRWVKCLTHSSNCKEHHSNERSNESWTKTVTVDWVIRLFNIRLEDRFAYLFLSIDSTDKVDTLTAEKVKHSKEYDGKMNERRSLDEKNYLQYWNLSKECRKKYETINQKPKPLSWVHFFGQNRHSFGNEIEEKWGGLFFRLTRLTGLQLVKFFNQQAIPFTAKIGIECEYTSKVYTISCNGVSCKNCIKGVKQSNP